MKALIDRLDHQGRGITYIDGKITFVENALPNEEVEIEIVSSSKKYNEAKVVKYLKQSPKRITPICPYYEECGGCNLLHISYDDQLKYKEEKVKNIMMKYASIKEDKIKKIVPSPSTYNYRNKVTLKVDKKLGYFKRKSNDIVTINYCYLLDDKLNNIIKKLNEIDIDKEIKEVVIRNIIDDDNSLTLSLQKPLKNYEKYKKIVEKTSIIVDNNIVKSNTNSNIIARLGNLDYIVSPTSFFQVNTLQTINLYDKILEIVKESNNPRVLDLYCGTGTIGLYISKYAKDVVGVEINAKAIEDAKINAQINDIKNARFYSGDTKKVLNENNFNIDLVIVDPPRQGLDEEVIKEIIDLNPTKLIYVSCDPITLARDLKLLSTNYNIIEITPFDMFPNTYHVENVVLIERK